MIKNKCIIILSHCDTDLKKEVLLDNIERLSVLKNFDIILTSHISLPDHIVSKVDYFIFDKSNPVLRFPEGCMTFWKDISKYRLLNIEDNYGWTVFNQIKKAGHFASINNYSEYYFINYDLIITDDLFKYFLVDNNTTLFRTRFREDTIFDPGIMFFILKDSDIKKVIDILDIEIYKNMHSAEDYFKLIVNVIPNIKSNVLANDRIRLDSIDMFNDSIDNNFKFFVSNKENSIYNEHIFIWDIKDNIYINIDGDIRLLNSGGEYMFKYKDYVIFNDYNLLELVKDKYQIIRDR